MELQKYIEQDVEYLKKIFNHRCGEDYKQYDLKRLLRIAESCEEDILYYILYSMNPLYDYFCEIGINDEKEMIQLLTSLSYIQIKTEQQS